jgi:thymidylate kinase
MARAEARGVDRAWLDALFSFVVAPDAVLLLDVDPDTTLARRTDAPDAYEAGLDLGLAADVRESYRIFAERLSACFERYAIDYGFRRIPAADSIERIGERIAQAADELLAARVGRATSGRR